MSYDKVDCVHFQNWWLGTRARADMNSEVASLLSSYQHLESDKNTERRVSYGVIELHVPSCTRGVAYKLWEWALNRASSEWTF